MNRDRIGRAIMAVVVILSLIAFADGWRRIWMAGPDRIWIEGWRTFAYLMFAGLFALLAMRPRSSPGIWELTFGHKTAVVLFGLWLGATVPEVSLAVGVDFGLVILIALSWLLCRGWMSWVSLPRIDGR